MVSLYDHLAAAFGRSVADAETALSTLVADIQARCRTYGEAAYPGLGTFRLGPDGMAFEPDPALAIVVNHRFAGLDAMPALEAPPDPAWATSPPPPIYAPLMGEGGAPTASDPAEPPIRADQRSPAPLPGEAFMPPGQPVVEAPAAAPPPEPVAAPPLRSLPPERPARSGRRLLLLPLALFVVLLLALAWWASTRWPASRPAPLPPHAAAPIPLDTTATSSDTLQTTLPSAGEADSERTPPPAATAPAPTSPPSPALSTDRPEVPPRRDPASTPASTPASPARQTPPTVTRRAAPAPPAATPPAPRPAVPTSVASAEAAERQALRGQEPVEAGRGGWTVVVGGEASEEAAEARARRFRFQGYRTGVLKGTIADTTEIYRVALGHFTTLAGAQAALTRLRGDVFPADAWLLRLR